MRAITIGLCFVAGLTGSCADRNQPADSRTTPTAERAASTTTVDPPEQERSALDEILDMPREPRSPESVGAVSLISAESFPPQQRTAAAAVAADIRRVREDPSEFFATVSETSKTLVFHLWHKSAFAPENANVLGNPGGKCRDIHYDRATGAITARLWWQ